MDNLVVVDAKVPRGNNHTIRVVVLYHHPSGVAVLRGQMVVARQTGQTKSTHQRFAQET
jgi:hypothetical protein